MTAPQTGWIVFLAAVGMMASLLAVDVSKMKDFSEVYQPIFVGTLLAHFGAVVTAFVGGRLLPNDPKVGGQRSSDPPAKP